MSCVNCKYQVRGECHRYPPVRHEEEYRDAKWWRTGSEILALWPKVKSDDWCGEFRQGLAPNA